MDGRSTSPQIWATAVCGSPSTRVAQVSRPRLGSCVSRFSMAAQTSDRRLAKRASSVYATDSWLFTAKTRASHCANAMTAGLKRFSRCPTNPPHAARSHEQARAMLAWNRTQGDTVLQRPSSRPRSISCRAAANDNTYVCGANKWPDARLASLRTCLFARADLAANWLYGAGRRDAGAAVRTDDAIGSSRVGCARALWRTPRHTTVAGRQPGMVCLLGARGTERRLARNDPVESVALALHHPGEPSGCRRRRQLAHLRHARHRGRFAPWRWLSVVRIPRRIAHLGLGC